MGRKKQIVKINSVWLALLLLFAVLSGTVSPVASAETGEQTLANVTHKSSAGSQNWFGDQLNSQARIFYHALQEMQRNGALLSGTGSIDLMRGSFAGDKLTANDVRAHLNGSCSLITAYQAGRDAFMNDYPDVFYVDFSKMTLRTSQRGSFYTAVLGPGSGVVDYYADGAFSSGKAGIAATALDTEISRIADSARAEKTTAAQLRVVHDAVVERAAYTVRGQGFNETGAYGALVKGTAVCEGYAHAFKAVLDELGIPCVLVRGSADGTTHMWCSVQMDGAWYAVDVTWDDPMGGTLRHDYFLKGSKSFSVSHQESGVFSPNGSSFYYPVLSGADYTGALS